MSEGDTSAGEIVWRELYHDAITRKDADVVLAHTATKVTKDFVTVLQLHGELGVLKNRRDLVSVVLTSFGAWLLEASMYYLLAIGFGGQVRDVMTAAATLLTTGVANLSALIPGAPGYIGQFEYGVKLVLSGAFDVPESQALAYAILVHAALYFPITLLGLVEWFRRSLSMRDLSDEPINGSSPQVG